MPEKLVKQVPSLIDEVVKAFGHCSIAASSFFSLTSFVLFTTTGCISTKVWEDVEQVKEEAISFGCSLR